MLYCEAYFIISVRYITYAFLHVHTGTNVVIKRLYPTMCLLLHACRSKYLVCICRKLTKHMYFLAYLVGGFHSHLHLSSFNININIHMKGECKTVPSLCKGGGGIYFCKINVLNKRLSFFWLLLQYTWSGILNLIKIIHVPQSITMRVTPPCVMCAALFRPCVLRTAMFWPRELRTV